MTWLPLIAIHKAPIQTFKHFWNKFFSQWIFFSSMSFIRERVFERNGWKTSIGRHEAPLLTFQHFMYLSVFRFFNMNRKINFIWLFSNTNRHLYLKKHLRFFQVEISAAYRAERPNDIYICIQMQTYFTYKSYEQKRFLKLVQ